VNEIGNNKMMTQKSMTEERMDDNEERRKESK